MINQEEETRKRIHMDELIPHRLNWAAIIVAIFMVVPDLFVGGIVANIYKWLASEPKL